MDSISPRYIQISGLSKGPRKFRNFFLRDGCSSEESVDTSTSQKTFSTASLDPNISAKNAEVVGDYLEVQWSDGRLSKYHKDWLERYSSLDASLKYRRKIREWKPWTGKSFQLYKIPYEKYIQEGPKFAQAIEKLSSDGLIQITDIPSGECGVGDRPTSEVLAERIGGYFKNTFYGTSWNVKSIRQAKNVAYTNVFLPLHMDLLYYESPPGIQLLHVIENSTKGGESYFADSYAAALHILETDPEAYDALAKIPVSYHYVNDGQHYFFMRPVIVEDVYSPINPDTGRRYIDHLNYSPPFQAPLDAIALDESIDDKTMDAFLRGLKKFEEFVESPENQIQFTMQPNTCIVFLNRRALHARREFDASSGNRWFKGSYCDIDAFYSTLRQTVE